MQPGKFMTIIHHPTLQPRKFSWMDDDMKKNRDSEYYIGKYYNPAGGVAEHFSKRIPGHSVWIQMDGKSMIYSPSLQPGNA